MSFVQTDQIAVVCGNDPFCLSKQTAACMYVTVIHKYLLSLTNVPHYLVQAWFQPSFAGVSVCILAYSMGTPSQMPFFCMAIL